MPYYTNLPARTNLYPDSKTESKIVERQMNNPDLEYFEMSDENLLIPFEMYLREKKLSYSPDELKKIVADSVPIVIAHKNYYNRPRPAQVNSNIVPPNSTTGKTPSYPAGHALQSYLVSKHLGRKHPRHKRKFQQIAERIAKSRVSVGLHYPSDNALAYKLSQNL